MQAASSSAVRATKGAAPEEPRWLVLFHEIPPTRAYGRVKNGRHLARIGAVGLKNAVYVLPRSEAALEDLQWVIREIVAAGGDATLCEARFVERLTNDEVERRFQEARDEDYAELARETREILKSTPKRVVSTAKAARSSKRTPRRRSAARRGLRAVRSAQGALFPPKSVTRFPERRLMDA